jgi:hypothetical protein
MGLQPFIFFDFIANPRRRAYEVCLQNFEKSIRSRNYPQLEAVFEITAVVVRPVTASKSRACRQGHASNAEARMTKDEGMTKRECNVLAYARNRTSPV